MDKTLVKKYAAENSFPVKVDGNNISADLLQKDLLMRKDFIRYDPEKISSLLMEFL